MTDQHPITPPPELFRQWKGMPRSLAFEDAYRAGADAELEACIQWLVKTGYWGEDGKAIHYLRAARRPKPPRLAEEALDAQERMWIGGTTDADWELIRRALKRLQELEGAND